MSNLFSKLVEVGLLEEKQQQQQQPMEQGLPQPQQPHHPPPPPPSRLVFDGGEALGPPRDQTMNPPPGPPRGMPVLLNIPELTFTPATLKQLSVLHHVNLAVFNEFCAHTPIHVILSLFLVGAMAN